MKNWIALLTVLAIEAALGSNAYALAPAPTSFWAGAQAGYNLAGNGKFADNFQASGEFELQVWKPRFLTDKMKGRLGFPIRGTLSRLSPSASADSIVQQLQSLVTSAEGVSLRLAPVYQVTGTPSAYGLTMWGTAGWRLNASKVPNQEKTEYLHQLRFSAGLEASIGDFQPSGHPATFGIELFVSAFDPDTYERVFGRRESAIVSGELTAIVPAYEKMGIIGQVICADNNVKPVWRIGVLIAPKKAATSE